MSNTMIDIKLENKINLGDITEETTLEYDIKEAFSFICYINKTSIRFQDKISGFVERNNSFVKCMYETVTKFFGLTIDYFDAMDNITKCFIIDYCKIFYYIANYKSYYLKESDILLLCLGKDFALNFITKDKINFANSIFGYSANISNPQDLYLFYLDEETKEVIKTKANSKAIYFKNKNRNKYEIKCLSEKGNMLKINDSYITVDLRGNLLIRDSTVSYHNTGVGYSNIGFFSFLNFSNKNIEILNDMLSDAIYKSHFHTKDTSFFVGGKNLKFQPFYLKNIDKKEIYMIVKDKNNSNNSIFNESSDDELRYYIIDTYYKGNDVREFNYEGDIGLHSAYNEYIKDDQSEREINLYNTLTNNVKVKGTSLALKTSSILEKSKVSQDNTYIFKSYSSSLMLDNFFNIEKIKESVAHVPSQNICLMLNKLKYKGFSSSINNGCLYERIYGVISRVLKKGIEAELSNIKNILGRCDVRSLYKRVDVKVNQAILHYITTGKLDKLNKLTNCNFVDILEFMFITIKLRIDKDDYNSDYYDFECKILRNLMTEKDYNLFLISLKGIKVSTYNLHISTIISQVLKKRGVQLGLGMQDTLIDYISNSINIKNPINIRFNSEERLKDLHDEVTKLYEFKTRGNLVIPSTLISTELIYNLIKQFLNYEYEFIKSDDRLYKEGKQQHHCVYTYKSSITLGSCIILSTIANDQRITIELNGFNLRIQQSKLTSNNIPVEDIRNNISYDISLLRYAIFIIRQYLEKHKLHLNYVLNEAKNKNNDCSLVEIDIKNTNIILDNLFPIKEKDTEINLDRFPCYPDGYKDVIFPNDISNIIDYMIKENVNLIKENEEFIKQKELKDTKECSYYNWVLDSLYTKSYMKTIKRKNDFNVTKKEQEDIIYRKMMIKMNKKKNLPIPQRGLALPSSGVVLTDNYNGDEDLPF